MLIRNIILLPLVFTCFLAAGQSYKYIYYLDQNFTSCEKSKSIYTGKAFVEDGLVRVDFINRGTGKYFMSAHYTDSTLSVLQGEFLSFYENKQIENEGNFVKGVKDGTWKKWNNTGHIIDSAVYENGKLLTDATFTYFKNTLLDFRVTDTVHEAFREVHYNLKGKMINELIFNGPVGDYKEYNDDGKVKKESAIQGNIFTEIDATFPGGDAAWKRYLESSLIYFNPADAGAPSGTYNIYVGFTVNEDGSIGNVVPLTHFGYGMEEKAVRMIKYGPGWIPAIKSGKKVKSFMEQPVTFVVNEE